MNVLVIGANGFLGSTIVQKCLSKKWRVDCIYNINKNNLPVSTNNYSINELDTLSSKYDYIFLVAAYIPHGNYNLPSKELLDGNIKLPLKISEQFPESKIIFSSSVSVYGTSSSSLSEQSSYTAPTLYGLSKLSGETIVKLHERSQIIRFSSLYGKGMAKKTFLPLIIENAKHKKEITILGTGSRLQNYIHVQDAVDLCLLAAESEQYGVYLGTSEKSYSNLEVANIVKEYISECTIQLSGEDRSPSFVYENTFTRTTLNFVPKISLEKGIKELIDEE